MNIELHGMGEPTSMRIPGNGRRGQTVAIHGPCTHAAQTMVMNSLVKQGGNDKHFELWPLRMEGDGHGMVE